MSGSCGAEFLCSEQCNHPFCLVCPTVVTVELARQSCMNPSQGIYGGNQMKSLLIHLFPNLPNYKHLLQRDDTSTWHLCQQHNEEWVALDSYSSFISYARSNSGQRHINISMHSTRTLINYPPIAWADSSTYQLSCHLSLSFNLIKFLLRTTTANITTAL
jgi:hypothetical protein